MSFPQFQCHIELFREHVVKTMSDTNEYKDISTRLESLLILADRILYACERHPDLISVTDLAGIFDKGEVVLQSFNENLLLKLEKWLKAIIYFAFPDRYEEQMKNSKQFTYFPAIKDLDLLTQSELDLKEDKAFTLYNQSPVKWFIYIAKKSRDFETHNTWEQQILIRNSYLTAILNTLIAPLYKHYDRLKEVMRGLITSPINSEMEFMLHQINGERIRHLNNFAAREEWLEFVVKRLTGDLREEGGYLVLTGTEGMGKSALCAKVTERLCVNRYLGPNAYHVQNNAPWLPGVLLHFGKSSRYPLEIVRSLLAQINTMLPEPVLLPKTNTQQNFKLINEYSSYNEVANRVATGETVFQYDERRDSYFTGPQKVSTIGGRKDLFLNKYASIGPRLEEIPVTDFQSQHSYASEENTIYYQKILYTALNRLIQSYGPVTLIIDALDEISSKTDMLKFLPTQLPPGVSALLTTRPNLGIDGWLERAYSAQVENLNNLEREEIPLLTRIDDDAGDEEKNFNDKVWKVSRGWPLHVSSISRKIIEKNGDFSSVSIEESINEALHEQAEKWNLNEPNKGNFELDILKEILLLLAVFEPATPLHLDDIVGYLEYKNINLTKSEIRQALMKVGYQIEGLNTKQERIKLSLKVFGDYIRETYCGHRETGNMLDHITNWLAVDYEVENETISRFLQYWLDDSQVIKEKFLKKTAKLIQHYKENKNIDKIKEIANITSRDQGYFSPASICLIKELAELEDPHYMFVLSQYYLYENTSVTNTKRAEKLLRNSAELDHYMAMIDLGTRLIDGREITQDIEEGDAWLRKAVNAGNQEASLILANRLLDGRGIPIDINEGIKLLDELVETEHERATIEYATRLLDGKGVETDIDLGVEILEDAAERGSTIAMVVLGERYLNGRGVNKNYLKGERWLISAAERDSPPAMIMLGQKYIRGETLDKHLEDGIYWLKKAAGLGSKEAMFMLSNLYLDGKYLECNEKEGEIWITKAAEAGSKKAMYVLGIRLLDGFKLPKRPKEGESWLKKSIEAGNYEAAIELGQRFIDGNNVKENKTLGEKYLRKAALAEYIPAYHALGCYLLDFSKTRKNIIEGEGWLLKGVETESVEAMHALSRYLAYGKILKKNLKKAEELLRTAIQKKHILSELTLGVLMIEKLIEERDVGEGERYLRKASQEIPQAMYLLGDYMVDGKFMDFNIEEAMNLYRRAIESGDSYYYIQCGLSIILAENELVNESHKEEAEKWLCIALEKGEGDAALTLGIYYYRKEKGLEKAVHFFRKGHDLGEKKCSINLAYMLRRNEIPNEDMLPSVEELLAPSLQEGMPLAQVNQALYLIQQEGKNWGKANRIISLIKEPETALKWWYSLAQEGDREGDLVIGWLVYHNKTIDPDAISPLDRFKKAKEKGIYQIPESFLKKVVDKHVKA